MDPAGTGKGQAGVLCLPGLTSELPWLLPQWVCSNGQPHSIIVGNFAGPASHQATRPSRVGEHLCCTATSQRMNVLSPTAMHRPLPYASRIPGTHPQPLLHTEEKLGILGLRNSILSAHRVFSCLHHANESTCGPLLPLSSCDCFLALGTELRASCMLGKLYIYH